MKKKKILRKEIEIPSGIEVKINGEVITLKGEKEELSREILSKDMGLEIKDSKLILSFKKTTRNQKRLLSTFTKHIKNSIRGLAHGFNYKLKICSGHFPMSVNVEGNKLKIKNFLGEKIPREASILDNVKVQVKGNEILVDGYDLEKTGQTASNIEQSTRITNRDRRVFQDGIYIVKKPERV
ncbi:50S ribosomal protein L6 [Candidatus Woesearchaeota archaeon]|nr:50S ribosomal protein L6 [Candidatus Woesearchaeota archaeon]